MDENVRKEFRRLFDRAEQRWPGGRPKMTESAAIVRSYIEAAENKTGITLREDARWFLLVNFYEVVFLPLAAGRSAYERNDILRDIKADINLVVETVGELGRDAAEPPSRRTGGSGPDNGGASSHAVMKTVDKLWRKLKTGARDAWGT